MIFDASDPHAGDTASVSIPGIDSILIIGDTPSTHEFSSLISQFTKNKNIYFSKEVEGAVSILKSIKFSIVIIDGDAEFNLVSCSRLISLHNSTARIILISTNLDNHTIISMKNKGIIHGFISMPCDGIMAHTILVQEQAKYHINKTLGLILNDPPKGRAIQRKLNEAIKSKRESQSNYTLIAISIVHETVSKYNMIIDNEFELDPVLFASFFSAISIFSEKFIVKSGTVESFEFNNQVVFIKNIDEIQYIFVFNFVNEENRKHIMTVVNTISQKLYLAYGDALKISQALSHHESIEQLIQQNLPAHQRQNLLEPDKKAQIINIREPNSNLGTFYDETDRVYEIHYVDSAEQLFDMINDSLYDIVIFNDFEDDFKWNKYMLNIVKDESPHTQSIAIVKDVENSDLSAVLNVNDLDLILEASAPVDSYFDMAKKAIERSNSIQDGIILTDLSRIYQLKNQPDLLKAMVRQQSGEDETITLPGFYSLYIMIGEEKFYSYYNREKDAIFESDESLFFGFISSLLTFTDELKNSPLVFSGIKYGNSNIIVRQVFEYYFIYFIGDLDQTNYDLVSDVMTKVSQEIHEVMKYDVNPHVLSDGLGLILDEICSGVNERFAENTNE